MCKIEVKFHKTDIEDYLALQEEHLKEDKELFFKIEKPFYITCGLCEKTVDIKQGIMVDYDPVEIDVDEDEFDENCGLRFFCNDACANIFILTYNNK